VKRTVATEVAQQSGFVPTISSDRGALGVVLEASAVAVVTRRVRSACSRRAVCLAVPIMALLLPVLATWGLAHHIYFEPERRS